MPPLPHFRPSRQVSFRQLHIGGWYLWIVAVVTLVCGWGVSSAPAASESIRAGKIEWTRLITPSPYWNRHAEADNRLLDYLATRTPLIVNPKMEYASPKSLENLCRYPFIYAHDVSSLPPEESANLAEFIKRGGFLFVDFCGNTQINPAPDIFLRNQLAVLQRHLPELRVQNLLPSHEVFSIYFKMTEFPPQTRPGDSVWLDGPTNPMPALYLGDRMIGIIGLNGLQCGWANVGSAEHAARCMQMIANIYIYAMSR